MRCLRFTPMAVGSCLAALTLTAQTTFSDSNRYSFREPNPAIYRVENQTAAATATATAAGIAPGWIRAWPEHGRYPVEFGSRVVLQLRPGADLQRVLRGTSLKLSRRVTANLFILEAPRRTDRKSTRLHSSHEWI